MTCDEIDELMSDLLDDELAESARAGVEQHIAACERCGDEWRKLRRTVRFVRANARVDLRAGTPGSAYASFTRALAHPESAEAGTEAIRRLGYDPNEGRSTP